VTFGAYGGPIRAHQWTPRPTLLYSTPTFVSCHERRIVVTDANIYVLEGDFWGTTKSKGLIAKHAIGSIPIGFRGRALMVGEERIWLHPFAEGDAEEIASLSAG
jgi:hypothetical protein